MYSTNIKDIDIDIQELIQFLWDKNIKTYYSCSSHVDDESESKRKNAYICLDYNKKVETLYLKLYSKIADANYRYFIQNRYSNKNASIIGTDYDIGIVWVTENGVLTKKNVFTISFVFYNNLNIDKVERKQYWDYLTEQIKLFF